ncbi:hypothetical protein IE53DRAFT_389966 [Violaceomyces palustris]|uniref:Uncharacterized protein n=1 Tax=Violaceomyces palustris TaxID=1673888 RepID=A0ACD0NQ52_9BASI|nr:hypothetical protein IE53DRAFT_389966 [Violaceomyces palustris]
MDHSKPSASIQRDQSFTSQNEASNEHAHHLKYGHIVTSGYEPTHDEEEPDDDYEADSNGFKRCKTGHQHHNDPSSNRTGGKGSDGSSEGKTKHKKLTRVDRVQESREAKARQVHSERRYLFRRPRALQYFRGNVLVRSNEERSSQRLELFFDLVFVGLIATLAEEAVHESTGPAVVRYILTYAPAWMIWSYMREIFNSFFQDDLPQRLLVLCVMILLVVFGNNAPQAEMILEEGPARATAIGSYLLAGLALFTTGMYYSFFVCQYRIQIRALTLNWLLAVGIWIGAIFVNNVRACIAMVVVALVIEYGGWMFFYSPTFKRMMRLKYSSAVAIEHEIERFADFVTLVHGEFLYSVLSGQPAGTGVHRNVAKLVFTVVIAFCFNGLYVNGSGSKKIIHPIRYSVRNAISWFSLHLPFVCSVTLCGDATAELVKEEEVKQGLRWIFCLTYAIGMTTVGLLAYTEKELDRKGEVWFNKHWRLAPRFVSAIVVLFLPLVDQEHLKSTGLLAIPAALSFATFLWQSFTSLDGPNCDWYHNDDQAEQNQAAGSSRGGTGESAAMVGRRKWRGFPLFSEPGLSILDDRHQRHVQNRDEINGTDVEILPAKDREVDLEGYEEVADQSRVEPVRIGDEIEVVGGIRDGEIDESGDTR